MGHGFSGAVLHLVAAWRFFFAGHFTLRLHGVRLNAYFHLLPSGPSGPHVRLFAPQTIHAAPDFGK